MSDRFRMQHTVFSWAQQWEESVLLKIWIGSLKLKWGSGFLLDEANSHFAVYQNTGCSVWFQFSFNYHVSVQISCGLWGWYPVSSWVNWPWKEWLYHTDEETPFPTLSCYFHRQSHMKGRTMAPRKEEKVSTQDAWFKYAKPHNMSASRMIIDNCKF